MTLQNDITSKLLKSFGRAEWLRAWVLDSVVESQNTSIQIPALPFISYVNLGKLT